MNNRWWLGIHFLLCHHLPITLDSASACTPMTELLHPRRDGLHPLTPFLSTLQILQSSRTWWQGMMCHHVRSNMSSLNREGLCTFVYTVHEKAYANFSRVVTGILQSGPVTTWRIFKFFQSGYAELSGAEIAWLCVLLKIFAYQVDIRLSTRKRTTSWLHKLSIRLRYFHIFIYENIPAFLIYPATYQPPRWLDS